MKNVSIELSINDVLKLVRQLPQEVKEMLMQEWAVEKIILKKKIYPSFQNFSNFKEPVHLKEYAVKKESLDELATLWEDELPASELCKMI